MSSKNNENSEIEYKSELECLNEKISELEQTFDNIRRLNGNLASLTINETYKNFYDWKVKPAVDIVALMSSSAANMASVANDFASNVYSKKHEVRKALKLSEKLIDQTEIGLELCKREIEYMLESSGNIDLYKKDS
ncbi:hypothetical protein [uncultured Clostridium sp.]|uniref:hypothetical protein n=1 Tax=uncultured Clostridium sp. TaxID=59620 RepID=UPI002634183D|nr:hypothetical protein [uncultured Clostridium sp.]